MYEIERSGYKEAITAGLVITGGTSQLANLKTFAHFITGMETKLAYPLRTLSEVDVNINRPSISTAVGLVLMGFEEFERMEKKGRSIKATTPMSPAEKEKQQAEIVTETTTAAEPETPKEQTKESKKSPWFKGFIDSFKSDNVFKDNEA